MPDAGSNTNTNASLDDRWDGAISADEKYPTGINPHRYPSAQRYRCLTCGDTKWLPQSPETADPTPRTQCGLCETKTKHEAIGMRAWSLRIYEKARRSGQL